MIRVFLDANVLTAASRTNEVCRAFFRLVNRRNDLELVTTDHPLEEAERVLEFDATDEEMSLYRSLTQNMVRHPEPSIVLVSVLRKRLKPVKLPANDLPILAGAISSDADYLITRDETHFKPLFGTRIMGVKVLNPRDGIQEIDPRP